MIPLIYKETLDPLLRSFVDSNERKRTEKGYTLINDGESVLIRDINKGTSFSARKSDYRSQQPVKPKEPSKWEKFSPMDFL